MGRDRSSTTTLLGNAGRSPGSGSESEEGVGGESKTNNNNDDGGRLDLDIDYSDDDLPPSAPTRLRRSPSTQQQQQQQQQQQEEQDVDETGANSRSARETLRGILSGGPSGDHGAWFRQLDEDYIKPTLLLDQSNHKGPGAV